MRPLDPVTTTCGDTAPDGLIGTIFGPGIFGPSMVIHSPF